MTISLDQIKELREKTGAGVMEAKQALTEADGDTQKALEKLLERGKEIAAKKGERVVKDGVIGNYIHATKKVASLVEVQCETDFVAKTEDFIELAQNIAMQVAAMEPLYLNTSEIPENADESAWGGRSREEVCLISQKYFKDDSKTIENLIQEKIAKFGENIQIGRFVRLSI